VAVVPVSLMKSTLKKKESDSNERTNTDWREKWKRNVAVSKS
jgi:hypothetical protein